MIPLGQPILDSDLDSRRPTRRRGKLPRPDAVDDDYLTLYDRRKVGESISIVHAGCQWIPPGASRFPAIGIAFTDHSTDLGDLFGKVTVLLLLNSRDSERTF
jgi:hypothetical protein